jgi:hypothetical protein
MRQSLTSTSLALAVLLFGLPAFAAETAAPATPSMPHGMNMSAPAPMAGMVQAKPDMDGMRGGCPMMKGDMMGRGGMGGGMHNMMTLMQHPEGQIAFLKTELKITPAQETAWSTFADALRAYATQMNGNHDTMAQQRRDEAKPLPETLSFRIQMMEMHLASLKGYQEAVAKLYGTLSDEQKKTADDLLGMGR